MVRWECSLLTMRTQWCICWHILLWCGYMQGCINCAILLSYYPTIQDRSTRSKLGAHGENGDVLCQAKNAPLAIWLYGVSVVHECRLTLIIWFPWNLNRPRKISSWSIASPCPPNSNRERGKRDPETNTEKYETQKKQIGRGNIPLIHSSSIYHPLAFLISSQFLSAFPFP